MNFLPGGGEWILIALVVLLLFGFKKLPDAARSIGKSARVFKSEVNEMKEEDRAREEAKKARTSGATPLEPGAPSVQATSTPTAPAPTTPISDGTPRESQLRAEGDAIIEENRPRTDTQSGPLA